MPQSSGIVCSYSKIENRRQEGVLEVAIEVLSAQSASRVLPVFAEHLKKPMDDIFAPDIVVVPGIGIANWIQEQLSLQFGPTGIVANVKFWLPNEFNAAVSSASVDAIEIPEFSDLTWAIFEHLSRNGAEGVEPAPGFVLAKRKLSFATRVAELFDKYSVHRPEMIVDWNAGRDTDGSTALPEHYLWQPKLWREINKIIGSDLSQSSSSDFLLRDEWQRSRITLFGFESFSRSKVKLLKLVSSQRDIKIFQLSPIANIHSVFQFEGVVVGDRRRGTDITTGVKNPLLRSWSRSALECAALLSTVADSAENISSEYPETVLGALQASIATDANPQMEENSDDLLNQSDGTVQIHLCHGPTRQVEVMRDALLHILKSDSSLRPRDILVLCTDIEKYSSLIEPVMSAELGSNGQKLSVSIIDKSASTSTPAATAVDTILGLAAGRCSLAEVLEAMSLEPVRTKFGFDDDELATISTWANHLNIKWGIDPFHRSAWKYDEKFEDGTWQLAIDRLSAGIVFQSETIEEHFPGVAAYDDVSGSNIETIGKLFVFYEALRQVQEAARMPLVSREWSSLLSKVVDNFLFIPRDEKEHLQDLNRVISQLEMGSELSPTAQFPLAEFRQYVASSLSTVRGSALKWADVIRVASPNRVRGVSARVIAILGFDVDAFRGRNSGGDDILLADPLIGERDIRADARLGLLTSIHSASDYLVITCSGHDINKNTEIPLAVPIEELKDAIALAISTIPIERRGKKPVILSHSRQIADRSNVGLRPDSSDKNVQSLVGDGIAWTFDNTAPDAVEQIANFVSSREGKENGFWRSVLPPPTEDEVQTEIGLSDLFDAVRRPIDIFVNKRLGLILPGEENGTESDFPLWPDALSYSQIGRELLDALQIGDSVDQWKRRKHLSGGLPLGHLANDLWSKVESEVNAIHSAVAEVLSRAASHISISSALRDVELESINAGLLRVIDTVSVRENTVLSMHFSTWNQRLRVLPWLQIAALTLQQPNEVWQAVVVSKAPKDKSKSKKIVDKPLFALEEFVLNGDDAKERADSARQVLDFANALRTRARRIPIPLFERASWLVDKSPSQQQSELDYELERPSQKLVYFGWDLDDFKNEMLIDEVDNDLPLSTSRYEAYATWLSNVWTKTVRVSKEAEPKKVKISAAKKKPKLSVEGNDEDVD